MLRLRARAVETGKIWGGPAAVRANLSSMRTPPVTISSLPRRRRRRRPERKS